MVGVGMMSRREYFFSKQETLLVTLSQNIARNLEEAIKNKGSASLLVSGGSTPKALFKKLRKIPLAWDKVTIGLCDERWVDNEHKDSNAHLVQEVLMKDEARFARFVGMYNNEQENSLAEALCSEKLKAELFPFDVVVLGMGTDAHTASLFPNNERLAEAFSSEELCITIEPTTAAHKRMSLTLNAILSAKNIYLHFEGKEKRVVYEEALSGEDKESMPIRAILNQKIKNIEVYYK
ncbi:MAG: 6-phosphogluconolactonase (EC, eukaryotic type [uncultured Sulfurovum sp.]|uniref:6-phosphogluconolactonase n=1 Tax=uncultured Sulfurovum sp. TaxID=269237 RepID=A0A6S6SB15_9BACT|nr:MAG: 6-phosphogluconolactonase (EC, eukaryotic type [uncultured Sulfurovum sp.]